MHQPDQHENPCHGGVSGTPPALFSTVIAVGVLLVWIGWTICHRPTENTFSPRVAARLTQSRINPNTANWASLVRIPGIGPARAQKLLAWRSSHRKSRRQNVFYNADDLRRIPSFGPKTIAKISPYLVFPIIRTKPAPPP